MTPIYNEHANLCRTIEETYAKFNLVSCKTRYGMLIIRPYGLWLGTTQLMPRVGHVFVDDYNLVIGYASDIGIVTIRIDVTDILEIAKEY